MAHNALTVTKGNTYFIDFETTNNLNKNKKHRNTHLKCIWVCAVAHNHNASAVVLLLRSDEQVDQVKYQLCNPLRLVCLENFVQSCDNRSYRIEVAHFFRPSSAIPGCCCETHLHFALRLFTPRRGKTNWNKTKIKMSCWTTICRWIAKWVDTDTRGQSWTEQQQSCERRGWVNGLGGFSLVLIQFPLWRRKKTSIMHRKRVPLENGH